MSIDDIMEVIRSDEFSNVSFSGGDPFYQVEGFTELARRIKAETSKTIWCWTGFLYEDIQADPYLSQLLPYIDVLVDGPFIEAMKDKDLLFRGSSNQRIIYLQSEQNPVDFIDYSKGNPVVRKRKAPTTGSGVQTNTLQVRSPAQ